MPTVQEKIALAEKLGLGPQVSIAKSLHKQNEIQKIIDGEFCRRVSKKELEDMFGITHHNKSRLAKMPIPLRLLMPILWYGGLVALFVSLVWIGHHVFKNTDGAEYVLPVICAVIGIPGFFATFLTRNDAKLNFESLSRTIINIPYGALLKIKEAQEKNLFDKIYCVAPDTVRLTNDPAIVGTIDTEPDIYYVLFAWDLDKDRETLS